MSNTIGWGKGASNNSIGWGNVGTNGFGSIYSRSNSGETDLAGESLGPNFIMEVDTSLSDGLAFIALPIQGTQPMTVDWGDGTVETVTQTALPSSTNYINHSYANSGVYQIKVSETLERVFFNNNSFTSKDKLTSILNWGNCSWTNFRRSFTGCRNLFFIVEQEIKNIENVTNFEGMFFFTGVNIINSLIFQNANSALNFSSSFRDNGSLSINEGLFSNSPIANNFAFCFQGTTLPVNNLSRLYIELSVFNTQDNVAFHGGLGQYDPNFSTVIDGITYTTGVERSNLVARGWTITDGGLEN